MLGLGVAIQKNKKHTPAGPYQKWGGYPDSPEPTTKYPYQAISKSGEVAYLTISETKMYYNPPNLIGGAGGKAVKCYGLVANKWVLSVQYTGPIGVVGMANVILTNYNIYTTNNYLIIHLAKNLQEWSTYPTSPVGLTARPYQCILNAAYPISAPRLICGTHPLYVDGEYLKTNNPGVMDVYALSGGSWVYEQTLQYYNAYQFASFIEVGDPIYANSACTVVYLKSSGSVVWTGYPRSPLDRYLHPYQCIATTDGHVWLVASTQPITFSTTSGGRLYTAGVAKIYKDPVDNAWVFLGDYPAQILLTAATLSQANAHILNEALTAIAFAKTTT